MDSKTVRIPVVVVGLIILFPFAGCLSHWRNKSPGMEWPRNQAWFHAQPDGLINLDGRILADPQKRSGGPVHVRIGGGFTFTGSLHLPEGAVLADAIILAGGICEGGYFGGVFKVSVTRLNEGERSTHIFDAKDGPSGFREFELQSGDAIFAAM